MTTDQIMALIRQVLPFIGGIATALGWLSAEQVATWTDTILQVAGPVLIAAGAIWSVIANTKSSIIKSASAMPEVKAITVTDPVLADAARSVENPAAVSRT